MTRKQCIKLPFVIAYLDNCYPMDAIANIHHFISIKNIIWAGKSKRCAGAYLIITTNDKGNKLTFYDYDGNTHHKTKIATTSQPFISKLSAQKIAQYLGHKEVMNDGTI